MPDKKAISVAHTVQTSAAGIAALQRMAQLIARSLDSYTKQLTENPADPMVLGYLLANFQAPVVRQHPIFIGASNRPKRIDFWVGGANRIALEFALRPANGGGELTGKKNASEIKKLARFTDARLRALVLVDRMDKPYRKEELEALYAPINAGNGKFKRSPIRVIYGDREASFHFICRPFSE